MEETKDSWSQSARAHCENVLCTRDRKYYCKDHKSVVCNICYTALHLSCCAGEIANKNDVQESIDYIKNLFSKIIENSDMLKAHNYIKDFESEFKRYSDSLQSIEKKFLKAIEKDEFTEFETTRKNAIQLQRDFADSHIFSNFSKYIILLSATKEDCLGTNSKKQNKDANCLRKYTEKIGKEIERIKQEEFKQKLSQQQEILIKDCNDRIKQLEKKIEDELNIKTEFEKKNKELEIDLHNQAEEFKTELKSVMDECERERNKSNAVNQLLQKLVSNKFDEIYEKNMGSKISNIKTCCLNFNLLDSNQKVFLRELELIKLKLPNIKRINIDNITDSDSELNSFLLNCTPNQFELFAINIISIKLKGIKADFYLEALCKVLKAVTKEVYIRCMDFSPSDFEQIVKASFNSERLIFRYCDIHCSTVLNFDTASKYNIKFLSFDYCGDGSLRKSDFKSDSSAFEYIIDAISKSGLKESLQILDIRGCNLDKIEVQKLLSKHGIDNILIIESGTEPLAS